jgi:hypothetical protein
MSDSCRVHRAIKKAVKQLYPSEPRGNLARNLETFASMITGIVVGKNCQLSKMASELPGAVHPASREKQMSRWVKNGAITSGLYFLPFVQPLLTNLATVRPLAFIMDGSAVARGCVTLMVSLIYGHRAIPIAWLVIAGEKGHFPAATHVALLREVKALVPEGATVVFLGDGEFDSPELQAEANSYGWEYVCRTAKNIKIWVDSVGMNLEDLNVERGQREFRKGALFTDEAYGPVTVIAWWGARYDKPIYLVSNMHSVETACQWYRKRAHIETFFSDQKSRGFQLDRSHLSNPARVMRLMLAACFAYLWVIYLGVVAQEDGWVPKIHRARRCDLSLFQLGLRLLKHLLGHDLALPGAFKLLSESVR